MNQPPGGRWTRREIAKKLIFLSASAVGFRADAEAAAATSGAASTPHKTTPPGDTAKIWLTLPSTPALPTPKRSDVVTVNGVPIFFARFGDGPEVLLLHGGLGNSNYWGNQILSAGGELHGHRHGHQGTRAQLSDLAQIRLRPVRRRCRGPSRRSGRSFRLARRVERRRDHRASTRHDTAKSRHQTVCLRRQQHTGRTEAGGSKSPVFASYAARCAIEYRHLSPHPERWAQLTSGLGAMWRSQPNFSAQQLGAIKSPTVISDGEYDEIIKREHTEQIARQIPNAKLMIQPSVSHFAMLQNPPQFNRAVAEFLTAAK